MAEVLPKERGVQAPHWASQPIGPAMGRQAHCLSPGFEG